MQNIKSDTFMFIDSTETINVQDIRFNEVTEGIDLKPKYKCEFCDKSFARKFNFDRHLQVHKQKVINVVCSECQKPFSNEANLKIHFNDVHNGKTMNSPERVVVAKRRIAPAEMVDASTQTETKCLCHDISVETIPQLSGRKWKDNLFVRYQLQPKRNKN